MSKRPADTSAGYDNRNGKGSRVDDGKTGVVKKSAPRLPTTFYKEGEPLKDLATVFAKAKQDGAPPTLEVRIPSHCLTSNNRQVRARQLWGSDTYTDDSDLVAVLMHCGYWFHSVTHPPQAVSEVRAVVKPLSPQEVYPSTARNSIRSRSWAAPIQGCSYQVEKCWVVTRSGTSVDLAPNLDGVPAAAPTFMPSHMERSIATRSSGGTNRHRQVQEVTVMFNLVNEPWSKYVMGVVADKGLKPQDWTSAKLHSQVMLLESHKERYELCLIKGSNGSAAPSADAAGPAAGAAQANGAGVESDAAAAAAAGSEAGVERYRFSRCRRLLPAAVMRRLGLPLPASETQVLHDNLQWEEIQWGKESVRMKGEVYTLVRIQFMQQRQQGGGHDEGGMGEGEGAQAGQEGSRAL